MTVKGHIVRQNVKADTEDAAKEKLVSEINASAVNCCVFISDVQVLSEEERTYQVECAFSISGELDDVERFSINSRRL